MAVPHRRSALPISEKVRPRGTTHVVRGEVLDVEDLLPNGKMRASLGQAITCAALANSAVRSAGGERGLELAIRDGSLLSVHLQTAPVRL